MTRPLEIQQNAREIKRIARVKAREQKLLAFVNRLLPFVGGTLDETDLSRTSGNAVIVNGDKRLVVGFVDHDPDQRRVIVDGYVKLDIKWRRDDRQGSGMHVMGRMTANMDRPIEQIAREVQRKILAHEDKAHAAILEDVKAGRRTILTAPNGEPINGVREIAVTLETITNGGGKGRDLLFAEAGETPHTETLSASGSMTGNGSKDMAARVWLDTDGQFWLYEDLVPKGEADEATIEDAAHRAAVYVCRGHLLHAQEMAEQGWGDDFEQALRHIEKALAALERSAA